MFTLNRLSFEQIFYSQSIVFLAIRTWTNFFNLYFIAKYKKIGLLNQQFIYIFFKQTLLITFLSLKKEGIFAAGFFNYKQYLLKKNELVKNKKSNCSIIYMYKLYGFFSNFKCVLSYKYNFQNRKAFARYSQYFGKRLPSVLLLTKNMDYIKTKKRFFHGQFRRLRICIFQSLTTNQLFNGLGYCIYLNDCIFLYNMYKAVCGYIIKKRWKNIH